MMNWRQCEINNTSFAGAESNEASNKQLEDDHFASAMLLFPFESPLSAARSLMELEVGLEDASQDAGPHSIWPRSKSQNRRQFFVHYWIRSSCQGHLEDQFFGLFSPAKIVSIGDGILWRRGVPWKGEKKGREWGPQSLWDPRAREPPRVSLAVSWYKSIAILLKMKHNCQPFAYQVSSHLN